MSNLRHAEIDLPPRGAAAGQEGRIARPHHKTGSARALVCGLTLGLGWLSACSDNPPRRENSEMTVDQPPAAAKTPATRAAAVLAGEEPSGPTGPLPASGRKYQVIVETAYFFDRPVQSIPNGRYLRRGDTFYGQGEHNGFVRAGFVQPNGASGTAWLKVQGLRPLSAGPAGSTAKTTPAARPPLHPRAARTEVPYEPNEAESVPADQSAAAATSGSKAVVVVDRAYFYNSPDLGQSRKAFCQRGDNVRVLEASDAAVRVTFTNWEKVTTTGWMRKDAVRFSR